MAREQMVNLQPEINEVVELKTTELQFSEVAFSQALNIAYNEMDDVPVKLIDPVAEVEKNLAHLQELQARMHFIMREVRYLMKI